MTDLSKTIEPKSDQLNADDLISGSKTLTITAVKVVGGDQPVSISYKGDDGKPYKPCKSMRRLMIIAWGTDGDVYVGRKITVYLDHAVKWAGSEVGGIRISHMSDIEKPLRTMLTEARGRKAAVTVNPIITEPLNELTESDYKLLSAQLDASETMKDLSVIAKNIKAGRYDDKGSAKLRAKYDEAKTRIHGA